MSGALLQPVRNAGRIWTEPASAATAGVYTADEQNNIDIYRTAKEATVNITSIVVQEDFFYGVYEGKGAGFGIHHQSGRPHPDELPRGQRDRAVDGHAQR